MMCDYAELIQSLSQVDRDTTGYERQADITAYWQSLLHQKVLRYAPSWYATFLGHLWKTWQDLIMAHHKIS